LKTDGKIIFNPVIPGLFILSFFGLQISWWGTSTGTFLILIMILLGIAKTIFERNIKNVSIYLLSIVAFGFVFSLNLLFSVKQLFVPGFIFFSLYILYQNRFRKSGFTLPGYYYGIVAAFFAIIIPKIGFFSDPLITSVVLTDIAFFILEKLKITFKLSLNQNN
jgi:hypothetical protein